MYNNVAGCNNRIVSTTAGQDYVMNSFELVFDGMNKGPICNDVSIRNDDMYELAEELTFNLTTTDGSVILEPAGGVLVILDDDGEITTVL